MTKADSSSADTLRARGEAMLADAFEAGLVEDATISASEAQAEAFWALREGIAPSERAHGFGEAWRIRQHMRQAAGGIGNCVDVEKDRAGDVALRKFGARIAPGGRQMPGCSMAKNPAWWVGD